MSNKYPYIATNGLNNFLIYAENTATLIGDESNCFSSGFKIVVGEDTLKNITREYLENTYGKVESKEYAEFISKLAMSAGFGFPFNKVKSNGYFSVSGGNIYFWGSENVASSLNEKLITIPLPPKEPESKEWPQVGDDVTVRIDAHQWDVKYGHEVDSKKGVVRSVFKDGKVTVYAVSVDGVCYCFVRGLLQKPKTPEQELRDELIAAMDDSGTAFTYAEYMAKYLLSNYELTKKPQ